MSAYTALSPTVWTPPATVRVRGAVSLVAGAGESARVYERFGRRISADGYVVAVFETDRAADAAAWLSAQDETPRVLAGSDRGAAAVLARAISQTYPVDALLVAGVPLGDEDDATAAAGARTACPVHLGVLGGDDARATSDGAAIDVPGEAELAAIEVPVLALHGGADPISPFALVRARLGALPRAELHETVGGLHDVLNDASHRSVAATVVLWLERLRTGEVDAPLVRSGRA